MLKDLLKKGDYMVKIDLKDAYLTVPIWRNHQKCLRFLWRDSLLEFACLPFGLASAPRVFTKLLKPALSILRQRGIRLIVYLDDVLLMAPSVEQVLQHAATTLNLLEGLGFTVNYLKSVLPSLFVSRLSYQLDQFVSRRPDPLAIHTDAFTLDWATFRGYAFPPFALIGRCLHQIQSQQVSHIVFVAPVWPGQPWYPLLLDLCIDFPLLLPVQEDLLTQGSRTHPLKHLQLAGWLLSAEVTKRQTFLRRVEKSSWQPGGKIPLAPIPLPGQNGVAGVVNRSMLIPFHHL